jgi:hypothetical protein
MLARARLLGGSTLMLLGLSGCPVTDDYYINAGRAASGDSGAQTSGGSDTTSQGGKAEAGSLNAAGGSLQPGGGTAGDDALGGSSPEITAGSAAQGGAPACVPTTERCNGHDDDCNDVIDELVCNSAANGTTGCSGFVITNRPDHGYMFCTGNTRDYAQAQEACAAQNMRLAWLETAGENTEVAKKVHALSNDVEVWLGADDIAYEGRWVWDGGKQFWNGGVNGNPVNGAFNAWGQAAPNNNNNEDCAIFSPTTATWGDRPCDAKYPYLCEEREP